MSWAGRRPSRPLGEPRSKADKPLSATMVACIDDATDAGGELVRFQGGYWAGRNRPRDHNGIPRPYHGTSTVEAIVSRGEAEYSEWRDGRHGRFPIAMRLRDRDAAPRKAEGFEAVGQQPGPPEEAASPLTDPDNRNPPNGEKG